MSNWRRVITQTRLSEEPYPTSRYICDDCEMGWDDTEDPVCVCDEEEEEE